ncbi:hypothetical protein NMY22_g19327 [Coprinellus aureogranulatus]|nr:hypothetical protein NMY22_g19327 [Coprinellus aureogranulatus]
MNPALTFQLSQARKVSTPDSHLSINEELMHPKCAAIDRATRHPSSLLRIRTPNLEIWRERQELRVHYHSLKLSFSLIPTERYTKPHASPTRFRTVGASIVLFASITASTRPRTSPRLSMTPKGHRSPEEAFLRTPNENTKDEPRLHLHYNEVNTRGRGSSGRNATQLALSLQVVNLTPSYLARMILR